MRRSGRNRAGKLLAASRYFAVQPGAGIGPIAFRGGHRDAEHLGDFLEREADEVAQFDDFRLCGCAAAS